MTRKKGIDYDGILKRALTLWGLHAHTYQNLIAKYDRLLDEKRELKKHGFKTLRLNPVNKSVIRELPEIEFLRCTTLEDADEFLQNKTPKQILFIIAQIDVMINENHSYRTLCNRIDEYTHEISHCKNRDKCSKLGYDTNYPINFSK